MRTLRLLTSAIAAVALMAGMAIAQSQFDQVAFDYFQGDEPPSPSDEAPDFYAGPGGEAANGHGDGCCQNDGCCQKDCCQKGCGGCGLGIFGLCDCCCLGDPWTLVDCCGYNIGGWFQLGYHTEGRQNSGGTELFNNYPHHVQLQQAWAFIEKEANGCCGCWDWGFRADYVYGTDGPNTQAFGSQPAHWDTGAGFNHGAYGSAIPQLYGTLSNGDLTIIAGHFFTVVGYEVVTAPDNFFYSHAFTMNNAEPFTHTGVLAEYTGHDNITLYAGWTEGWDTGFSDNGGSTFLGGAGVQVTDNLSVTYICTAGDFGNGGGQGGYSHSIVAEAAVSCNLTYIIQSDYIKNDGFVGVAGDGRDEKLGLNQYLIYEVNDCISHGARFEWFDDDAAGDDVVALTIGTNVRTHANVVIRPEVRWHWYGDDYVNAAGAAERDEAFVAMDVIMTY